jgi:hypothetical protein
MGPRTWPVRVLPNWLVACISIVVLGDAVLIAVTASVVTIRAHDLEVFAGLAGGRDQVQMISTSRGLSASAS